MKIVIDIPDEEYEDVKKAGGCYYDFGKAIFYGTPLPKNHGRLIDANRLRSMYSINRANFNTVVGIQKWIDEAPTIIEADTEREDKI